MVLGLNFSIDDTLNLLSAGCYRTISTPRFGSPWRVLRAWPWKVPGLLGKKKKRLKTMSVCIHFLFLFSFISLPFFFFIFLGCIWKHFFFWGSWTNSDEIGLANSLSPWDWMDGFGDISLCYFILLFTIFFWICHTFLWILPIYIYM